MATLQSIISSGSSLTFNQLKSDRSLTSEIQLKLANLGFYPGGGWIDGDLGDSTSFTWTGLIDFCKRVGGVPQPSNIVAIDPSIAQQLLDTQQIPTILNDAANTSEILDRLKVIQKASPIVNTKTGTGSAFVSRTINNSPIQTLIAKYPDNIEQKPDGIDIAFADSSANLFTYPDLGDQPTIDDTGLDFLASNISHACVCIGGFEDSISPVKVRWFGHKSLDSVTLWWSTTKFIGVLNTVCQINQKSASTDIKNCVIKSPRSSLTSLVRDMVTYQGKSSNAIGALFKSFTKREVLSAWIKAQTGNINVDFRGSYSEDPLISPATIEDLTDSSFSLRSTSEGDASNSNQLAAYDLVRLISMLGWHPHLTPESQLPSAQWESLKSIVQEMGNDTARYVDVALETLGLVNVISEPVIISKVGWGDIINSSSGSMTYAAFVKFIDRRTNPGKLRTFALALRCPKNNSSDSFDFRDTRLAAAVTEIVRRIVTEELA
jgi:hypothetical protein